MVHHGGGSDGGRYDGTSWYLVNGGGSSLSHSCMVTVLDTMDGHGLLWYRPWGGSGDHSTLGGYGRGSHLCGP